MAEQLHMEALVEFASKNADLTEKQVKSVQDAVDHLNRNGKIDELVSNKASQRLESSRKSVRGFSDEFKKLRQEIAKTNSELASSAQSYVSGGGRDPLGNSASQLSASQARRILAVEAAGSMTATKAAQERLNLEDRLNKAKSQGAALDKDLINAGKSRATVARENLAAAEAEIAALKSARSAAPQTGRRGVSGGGVQEDVAFEEALTAAKKRRNQAQIDLNKSTEAGNQNLAAQRYAQYDLATTYGAVTAALVGLGAATTAVFADIEKGFATVQSVTATFNDESAFKSLEQDLLDLSRTLPVTVEGIQQLAVRGAQLGVANNELDNFVDVMSKFVAVNPDANINDVAEAFGRIANLTGVRDFERLASAISAVGIEGASTSPQILKTTQEVAPLATAAGMTADEIIGLSSALASLSQPPERARSAFGSLYNTMDKGIAGLNDKLPAFASFLGKTSEETAKLYKTSPAQFIRELTQALAKTDNMTVALSNLGLSEKRAQQVFGALAASARNSADGQGELARQMDIATRAYQENVALQQQFQPIADTLAAKWQLLKNALVELAYTAGVELGPAIAGMADALTGAIQGVTDFISTPVGEWSVKFVAALGTVVAAYTGLRTAIALATGAQLAFQQITMLTGRSGVLSSLQGLTAGFQNTAKSANQAAGGAATFAGSLKNLLRVGGVVGAIVLIIDVLSDVPKWAIRAGEAILWFVNLFSKATTAIGNFASRIPFVGESIQKYMGFVQDSNSWVKDLGNSLKKWGTENKKSADSVNNLSGSVAGLNSDLGDLESGAGGASDALGGGSGSLADGAKKAEEAVRTLLDYASDLSSVMTRAFDIRFGGGAAADNITKTFQSLRDASDKSLQRIRDLRLEIRSLAADLAGNKADLKQQEYFLSIAVEYGDTKRAEKIQANIQKLQADIAKQEADLTDKQKDLSKERKAGSKTLKGNSEAAVKNRDALRGLVGQYQEQIDALAKSGMSQEDLKKKVGELQKDFEKQATQLGFSRDEVKKYSASFEDMAFAIEEVPRDVTIDIDSNPALTALRELKAAADSAADSVSGIGSGGGGGGVAMPSFDAGSLGTDWATPDLTDEGEESAESWTSGFMDKFKGMSIRFKAWFDSLPGELRSTVEESGANIWFFLTKALPLKIENARRRIENWFKNLPRNIQSTVGRASGFIWERFVKPAGTSLRIAFNAVREWFRNLPDRLRSLVIRQGLRTWNFFRNELPAALALARQRMRNWFSELPGKLKSSARNAGLKTLSHLNRMGTVLSKMLTRVRDWLKDLPSRVLNHAKNAARNLWNNFSSGFESGARAGRKSSKKGSKGSPRYWEGGFTGRGGKYEPAGTVHKGEYVIPKKDVNQATGLPYADALGRLARGSVATPSPRGSSSGSSGGSSVVSLTPGTIQALAHATQKAIYLDGKKIADSSSNSYRQDNVVGRN